MSIGNVAIGNVAIVSSRQSTDLSHDVASTRAAVKECRAHHRFSVLGCLWRMDFALVLLLCILAVVLPMRLGERRLRV